MSYLEANKIKQTRFRRILNRFLRWLKYRYARKRVAYEKYLSRQHKKNQEQILGIRMVKLLATRSDSEILIAPLSNKYYIRNSDVFIIVERGLISIINTTYHYDIYTTDSIHGELTRFLDKIVERRRLRMEDVMRAKTEKSLQSIINSAIEKYRK